MSYASDLLAFMQYGGANQLGREQLGETGREFDITSGLQKEQLGEGRRQFDITSGLSRAQWEAENALRLRQMGLTEQQVKQQLQLSREKAARDVGQQAFENHQRLVDQARQGGLLHFLSRPGEFGGGPSGDELNRINPFYSRFAV